VVVGGTVVEGTVVVVGVVVGEEEVGVVVEAGAGTAACGGDVVDAAGVVAPTWTAGRTTAKAMADPAVAIALHQIRLCRALLDLNLVPWNRITADSLAQLDAGAVSCPRCLGIRHRQPRRQASTDCSMTGGSGTVRQRQAVQRQPSLGPH
jgi:hypothetical protein